MKKYTVDKYDVDMGGIMIHIDGHEWLHQCQYIDGVLYDVIDDRSGLPCGDYQDSWDGEEGIPAEYRELAKEILDKEIPNTMFYSEVWKHIAL